MFHLNKHNRNNNPPICNNKSPVAHQSTASLCQQEINNPKNQYLNKDLNKISKNQHLNFLLINSAI